MTEEKLVVILLPLYYWTGTSLDLLWWTWFTGSNCSGHHTINVLEGLCYPVLLYSVRRCINIWIRSVPFCSLFELKSLKDLSWTGHEEFGRFQYFFDPLWIFVCISSSRTSLGYWLRWHHKSRGRTLSFFCNHNVYHFILTSDVK